VDFSKDTTPARAGAGSTAIDGQQAMDSNFRRAVVRAGRRPNVG